jgi:hypothetical protein
MAESEVKVLAASPKQMPTVGRIVLVGKCPAIVNRVDNQKRLICVTMFPPECDPKIASGLLENQWEWPVAPGLLKT